MKKILLFLLSFIMCFTFLGCGKEPPPSEELPTPKPPEPPKEEIDLSYRQERNFSEWQKPSHVIDETKLPKAAEGTLINIGDSKSMLGKNVRLDFKFAKGKYAVNLVSLETLAGSNDISSVLSSPSTAKSIISEQIQPVRAFIRPQSGSAKQYSAAYDAVIIKPYGYLATAVITTDAGTKLIFEDRYYFAKEGEADTFNVNKLMRTENVKTGDTGFESVFLLTNSSAERSNIEWFIPNRVFKNYGFNGEYYLQRETYLGMPMVMMNDKNTGFTVSVSRYQPQIHYENNSYASIGAISHSASDTSVKPSLEICYPSRDSSRKYHTIENGAQHTFDVSIRAQISQDYSEATADSYNAHFNLQNQRIVATDINEVYKSINTDFKEFLQETTNVADGYKEYGLPWRITIEDGAFGPLTYQAGFVGQQIPNAYNMMMYGIKYNDLESLQNGINVIDFWVNDASFVQLSGVPKIWYDTWSNNFRAYPTFLRMAIDAMEGLLDCYRICEAHGIFKYDWYDSIEKFADFLVNFQNDDGSWYRCYNWDGEPFKGGDNGIPEPDGNICQSTSKENSTMPIRFLGKMYEMTDDVKYKDAAILGGNYVYKNIYPNGVYRGGTCDNPNKVDKEAGVYAMYCYDTLYTLTGDTKWIKCLKQATAFTMSTCQVFSFPVRASNLKSAYPLNYGYNDGVSFISCEDGGVDNYIAYIYYELFRIYVITGETTYLKQAEFIQQNTKSIMNWDGKLNYKYKSLVAEASTIWAFSFSSADNGVWLPWSSAANAEPIAKMMDVFGDADVMAFSKTPIKDLREILANKGVGGKPHTIYENTVTSQFQNN